jgi:hypothetical protein
MTCYAPVTSLLLLCLALSPSLSIAQSHALPPPVGGITFEQVIRLSKSGLSDTTIIAQIKKRPKPFDLSADQLLQLQAAHVSDSIIEVMAKHETAQMQILPERCTTPKVATPSVIQADVTPTTQRVVQGSRSEPPPVSKRGGKNVQIDFPLPTEFSLDIQIAATQRSKLPAPRIDDTELSSTANQVFSDIVGTTIISASGLPYNWHLSVLNDDFVNAHSLGDGEIAVDGGLAKQLGADKGLWSAVLSHEVAHTARRHAVKMYLYQQHVAQLAAYYRARAAVGDKSASWALLGLEIGAAVGEKKLSRDLEHDADITGMMLMARAGYHPDYVFAVHHLLRLETGDQSKFAAFFSTHPRWQTRDQRDDKAYTDALSEYNRLWPDPQNSPGGSPPLVVFLGKPTSVEDKNGRAAIINLPIYCRNAKEKVTVELLFSKDNHAVHSESTALQSETGALTVRRSYQCGDKDDAVPFTASIPSSAVTANDRKMHAQAVVLSSDNKRLERSDAFNVHVPKI